MQDIYLYAEDRILGLKLGDEIELWCRDDKLDSKYVIYEQTYDDASGRWKDYEKNVYEYPEPETGIPYVSWEEINLVEEVHEEYSDRVILRYMSIDIAMLNTIYIVKKRCHRLRHFVFVFGLKRMTI